MKTLALVSASALAGFAVFCAPAPAQDQTPLENLLTRIKETGTSLAVDAPRICGDKDNLSMYEHKAGVIDQLTICIDNHDGNDDALINTVIYEAVHIAQACKGGTIYTLDSLLEQANAKDVHYVTTNYPADEGHQEIEARVIAAEMDPDAATALVEEYCFE
jgi:hypothetical protein